MNTVERRMHKSSLGSFVDRVAVVFGLALVIGAGSAAANLPPQISPIDDLATATSVTTPFITITVTW